MKNVLKKLAAFQWEVPIIVKKTKGYGYNYADLPTIIETLQPLLQKNGLGFYQSPSPEGMVTVVFDAETGEEIKTITPMQDCIEMKGMNAFQVDGTRITYYRRYALACALGLVTDEDTDAAGEQVKKVQTNQAKTKLPFDVKILTSMLDASRSKPETERKSVLKTIYAEMVKHGKRSQEDMERFSLALDAKTEQDLDEIYDKMAKLLKSL